LPQETPLVPPVKEEEWHVAHFERSYPFDFNHVPWKLADAFSDQPGPWIPEVPGDEGRSVLSSVQEETSNPESRARRARNRYGVFISNRCNFLIE
jgi:hypothetical protein